MPTFAVICRVGDVVSTLIWLLELILLTNEKSDIIFPAESVSCPELILTDFASSALALSPFWTE